MRKYLKILSILPFCITLSSSAQDCNCKEDITALQSFIIENYPGYNDKIQSSNTFEELVDSLKKSISKSTSDFDCYNKLRKLVTFFKDPHLSISVNNQTSNIDRITKMFSNKEQPSLPTQNIKIKNIDKITGEWEIKGQGSYYKIFISNLDKHTLIGKIIADDNIFWFPGQIKCILKKIDQDFYKIQLFTRDHAPVDFVIKYESGNLLDMSAYGIWQRHTTEKKNLQEIDSATLKSKSIEIKEFKHTVYLRIPSFDISHYTTLLQILKEKIPADINTKNLIIDIRGNSGGSTVVSSLLLKYVYKIPIQLEGSSFKTSKQNIEDFEKIVSRPSMNSINKEFWESKLKLFKENPNSLVTYTEKRLITIDSLGLSPKKTYILVNNFSSSTSEYFLLQAIQNKDVLLIGQQTRGAIDYTDVGLPHSLPSQLFNVQTPMVRSNRLSIIKLDNIGIKPHILLPESTDALEYVKKLINE